MDYHRKYNITRDSVLYRIDLCIKHGVIIIRAYESIRWFGCYKKFELVVTNTITNVIDMDITALIMRVCSYEIIDNIVYDILSNTITNKLVFQSPNRHTIVCTHSAGDIAINIYGVNDLSLRMTYQTTNTDGLAKLIQSNELKISNLEKHQDFDEMYDVNLPPYIPVKSFVNSEHKRLKNENRNCHFVIDTVIKFYCKQILLKLDSFLSPIAKIIVSYAIS